MGKVVVSQFITVDVVEDPGGAEGFERGGWAVCSSQAMAERNLVDEYRLMVFPTLLGAGKRLLGDTSATAALRMVSARPAGETLIVIYEPAPRVDQA